MSITERFNLLIKSLNFNPTSFSKEVGLSQTSIRNVVDGTNQPSAKILVPLLERFPNVNINWLLIGQGDMWLVETGTIEERLEAKNKIIKLLEQSVNNLEQTIELQKKTIKDKEALIKKLEQKTA